MSDPNFSTAHSHGFHLWFSCHCPRVTLLCLEGLVSRGYPLVSPSSVLGSVIPALPDVYFLSERLLSTFFLVLKSNFFTPSVVLHRLIQCSMLRKFYSQDY